MTDIAPARPSRRAAMRRQVIADDSEDENDVVKQEESEEEFRPSSKSPRRQSRRITGPPATPRSSARTRASRVSGGIEPPETLGSKDSAQDGGSPSKKGSPRKRQSTAPSKNSRTSIVAAKQEDHEATMMRIQEEPQPLGDITKMANNFSQGESRNPKDFKPVKAMDTIMEKPMDIAIRTRALPAPVNSVESGPKVRTVIRSLVLHNFKSYAGRQEVGPFHASFSSVVGPNGSGKSNVIDSLLFVFGFRASKMRQGKISALIHNSAAFPDLQYCEVEVHFQEVMDQAHGGHEVLPSSDLVVSRKAFKNNSSKYYINGRESNFTDVTGLLKGRGVDLDHKRFLILQGEVESIAQMKPKAANEHDDGLLEYLEDIIGTSKYKTPIDEAAAEVDSLNEVCSEKIARVQHVEKEKSSLEDKRQKAIAYVRDENELVSKQSALYQVYIQECSDNLQVTDEAMEQMQAKLTTELEKHQGNEDGIQELERAHKACVKGLEALQKSTQATLKEMAKHDKENVKFEERKKFLNSKHSKLEKTIHASHLAASEARSLIQKHSDDMERKSSEISELEKETEAQDKELSRIRDNLKSKTQDFSDEIASKQKLLDPWNAQISGKQSAVAVAQSELDILRQQSSAGMVALEEARSKAESSKANRKAKQTEIKDLGSQHKAAVDACDDMQLVVDKLVQADPEIKSKYSGAQQKADEARATLASSQSQSNVLNGLLRLKESGRIQGFHGRLGNLGTIEKKYDVAISTACPSLENLVVDTVEVGQQCIDHLRKNSLGRANIILLNRLPRRDLTPIQTPEDVPRLFDLVKPANELFAPAFFSVLQNTLVAENLEQANRIAYGGKRWRVVTLDGQLIDVSGTMSGGGNRVARGGMSSRLVADTTKEQVTKLEASRDALEADLLAHQKKLREAESELKELERQPPLLQTSTQKATLELRSLEKNVADAERRVQELSSAQPSHDTDDTRVTQLEQKITGLNRAMEKLRAESAGLEEEIQALQGKIMEVGGVKLRSQKAKVDGLKHQIETLQEEVSEAEVAKSRAEKQKAKQEKAKADAEDELSTTAGQIEKLTEEVSAQQSLANTVRQEAEDAKEALSSKQEEMEGLKAELNEKTAELNELRAAEIEIKNKLEENQKIKADNQKKVKYWNEKIGKLSLQNIEQNIDDTSEEQPPAELAQFTRDELADVDRETLKGEIAALEEKTQNVNVDLGVLEEYRRRVQEHAARNSDLQTTVGQRDAAKSRCDEFRRLRLEGFMTGFSMISARLKEMYQMITMGGNAELELVDSLDPFSEGILFSVMPPKKSWKNISNLSGGEKTLSSLALVFALHHYKPTPLYVMDEIDAALDFRNVSIVASYIKERTKNAQFIVISLRNNMFELASRLVGVYKVNHMTKSVTVENRDYIVGRS